MQSAIQKQRCQFQVCAKKTKHSGAPPEGRERERDDLRGSCCRHSLPKACPLGLDTHGGTCIYMHVWCAACGHSISACPPPRRARSPFSGVRHHSAGVSRNLIQEALQGVLGCGGAREGRVYPKVPGPYTSRLRAA